jgi:hypothetical protein
MKHKTESPVRLTERGKNAIAGVVGLAALAGVGVAAEAASHDNSIHNNTHEERVSVTAGQDGNSEIALAHYIQKLTHTPDPTELLVGRLDAKDPGHDANLGAGQELTITVDVPNTHK